METLKSLFCLPMQVFQVLVLQAWRKRSKPTNSRNMMITLANRFHTSTFRVLGTGGYSHWGETPVCRMIPKLD